MRFEQGRIKHAVRLLEELKAEADAGPPALPRTWSDEHVTLGSGTATFVGEAVEHFPAHGDLPASTFDGWNTLVWVREGSSWKVAHWQCDKVVTARDEWNDVYRRSVGFTKAPNRVLVDAVEGRTPGAALDVAAGQGRNAIFLASRGWKVTAVDISDEGVRLMRDAAAKQKLSLDAIEADLETWDYGNERWDLVTMIYAGAEVEVVEKIKRSLKPGGLFVVEVFHQEGTAGTRSGGFATGQLASLFEDGFRVLRDDVVEDRPDWGGPTKVKLVRFVAQKSAR